VRGYRLFWWKSWSGLLKERKAGAAFENERKAEAAFKNERKAGAAFENERKAGTSRSTYPGTFNFVGNTAFLSFQSMAAPAFLTFQPMAAPAFTPEKSIPPHCRSLQ
jgi:hypothetical protein